jgi:hypothetical protein
MKLLKLLVFEGDGMEEFGGLGLGLFEDVGEGSDLLFFLVDLLLFGKDLFGLFLNL